MRRFEFKRDVVMPGGLKCKAGQIVAEKDLPLGSVEPALRLGHMAEITEPAKVPDKKPAPLK